MRRRILLLVVGMTTLVVLAFAIPLAVLIRHNVYADAVTRLQSTVNSVGIAVRGNGAAVKPDDLREALAELDNPFDVSVQLPSGKVVGTLPPGPLSALPRAPSFGPTSNANGGNGDTDDANPAPAGAAGPQTAQAYAGGRLAQLRLPVGQRPGPPSARSYVIRVWASDATLNAGETGWWWLLGGASIGLLLLGAAGGEIVTRRIVRPLLRTADTAHQLAAGDVTARAPTSGPPEVAQVGRSLNRLADRIDELIAEERETVADLSHRLRTPLTALRLDAEALRDPADAERIGAQVSVLERMLTAVIRAARRPQREGRLPSCDATLVVGERVGFWSALAEDQGRAGTITLPDEPLTVRAGAEDLAAAVDALLENVIAHTPEGTAYAVTLTPTASGARLQVADSGPGLPPESAERGRSDRGSSGLGLDIARRCAEATGGSMTLRSGPNGGAEVTLDLHAP